MSYKISFGDFNGKTHEWLFFNAPWYAEFIYENEIHLQEDRMDDEEGEHFLELYRRAWGLTGVCRDCKERPITRLGLTWQHNGNLGMIGFYCEECEYMGGSATEYQSAAFFSELHTISRTDQRRIAKEIARLWLGAGRITQARMEAFFHNDGNFVPGRKGFFNKAAIGSG